MSEIWEMGILYFDHYSLYLKESAGYSLWRQMFEMCQLHLNKPVLKIIMSIFTSIIWRFTDVCVSLMVFFIDKASKTQLSSPLLKVSANLPPHLLLSRIFIVIDYLLIFCFLKSFEFLLTFNYPVIFLQQPWWVVCALW